jgi:hypothetical protein
VDNTTVFDRWREGAKSPAARADDGPDDGWDEPSGDGRTSRQQVLGVQLIDGSGRLFYVPYAAVLAGEGVFNGTRFRLEFARGDRVWEAVITGTAHLQYVVDKLTEGKRCSVRVNGATVESIVVRPVGGEPAAALTPSGG